MEQLLQEQMSYIYQVAHNSAIFEQLSWLIINITLCETTPGETTCQYVKAFFFKVDFTPVKKYVVLDTQTPTYLIILHIQN